MGSPCPAVQVQAATFQRLRPDRRLQPTPMLSRYAMFGGRRATIRRGEELEGSYVDLHGTRLFVTVTTVAMLNFFDAFFTVLYLSYGGRELNPVVQESLDWGMPWFIALKSVGIGLCLLFLTVTKNSQFSRYGLGVILAGYTALTGWHAVLYVSLGDHMGIH